MTNGPSNSGAVPAADQLAATTTTGLLRAGHALTHRIHETTRAPVTCARDRGWYEDDLRAQRDLVDTEIVRRTLSWSPRDDQP